MNYIIEVDKYELNRLKAAMLHQYEHDRQYRETCLKTNNFDGADLAQDSMTSDLKLLVKLENIIVKADSWLWLVLEKVVLKQIVAQCTH